MTSRAIVPVLLFLLVALVSNARPSEAIGAPADLLSTATLVTGPAVESQPAPSRDGISDRGGGSSAPRLNQIPAKAQAVLNAIQDRGGDPPPGYVGGRTFQNRERRLPPGHYREYDVNPKRPGKNRGGERIVIEQRTGKAYYSGDHYQTFVPMN